MQSASSAAAPVPVCRRCERSVPLTSVAEEGNLEQVCRRCFCVLEVLKWTGPGEHAFAPETEATIDDIAEQLYRFVLEEKKALAERERQLGGTVDLTID